MKKPSPKTPVTVPGKSRAMTGIPVADVVARVGDTAVAVVGLFTERQKTRQVIAGADAQKHNALEKTKQVRDEVSVQLKQLDVDDRQNERQHVKDMAELGLRAQQQADEREMRRARVEKEIIQAEDRLSPPRGQLE